MTRPVHLGSPHDEPCLQSKDSDQTVRILRLIWGFAERAWPMGLFVMFGHKRYYALKPSQLKKIAILYMRIIKAQTCMLCLNIEPEAKRALNRFKGGVYALIKSTIKRQFRIKFTSKNQMFFSLARAFSPPRFTASHSLTHLHSLYSGDQCVDTLQNINDQRCSWLDWADVQGDTSLFWLIIP